MTSRAMAQILDKVSARAPHAASDGPRNFRAMPRPSALCAGGVALASLPQPSAAPLARGARVISGSLDGTTRGGGVLPCAQLSCEGCTLPLHCRCRPSQRAARAPACLDIAPEALFAIVMRAPLPPRPACVRCARRRGARAPACHARNSCDVCLSRASAAARAPEPRRSACAGGQHRHARHFARRRGRLWPHRCHAAPRVRAPCWVDPSAAQ